MIVTFDFVTDLYSYQIECLPTINLLLKANTEKHYVLHPFFLFLLSEFSICVVFTDYTKITKNIITYLFEIVCTLGLIITDISKIQALRMVFQCGKENLEF